MTVQNHSTNPPFHLESLKFVRFKESGPEGFMIFPTFNSTFQTFGTRSAAPAACRPSEGFFNFRAGWVVAYLFSRIFPTSEMQRCDPPGWQGSSHIHIF